MTPPYLGKYPGIVANNVDPERRGRLQVKVHEVYGSGQSSWALPCVPYAGPDVGFFAIPPIGASIWVEFQQGDPDYPIWTGCFWGPNQSTPGNGLAEVKILKTSAGAIKLSEIQGEASITIETSNGMKIAISSRGIEIDNGQNASIKLSGAQVSINGNALEIT